LIFKYRQPNDQSWLGAYLWGLASGAGFGLAEGIIYASDFYNGVTGAEAYFVRNISCVALHALWTGSAAITIHRRQHLFQGEMAWHDWLVRSIAVVAVPMTLHGLYDTLLKKEMNALALAVAVFSFGFLAFQISRLRGVDDKEAHEDMLRDYQSRRKAMGGRRV
jgi:RsiW-degrading membrane proteinase PrsW (M82 family)